MPRYDLVCPDGHEQIDVVHSIKEPHPNCPECGAPTSTLWRTFHPAINGDEIPGGLLIRHGAGMINADGSPKRYYYKSDIKRAANEAGWTISGDTPKPYKVPWSGKPRGKTD